MLDPQAAALIALMAERGIPPVWTQSPAEARLAYRERRFYTQPEPPAVGTALQAVQSLQTDGGVPLRLFTPASPATAPGQPLAALVYLHGGGWTIGDLDTHDVLCRQLCAASGCAVVSVDYRLGPEHRFPAAVDDAIAAVRWVRRQAAALGLDAARLGVGGDSAGGNLAAVVALALRDADTPADPPLRLQLLIYPATDMRCQAASHTSNGEGYLLTRQSIDYYRGHYVADAAQWLDWRASPLLAADLRGLPPALVLTAGYDPLRDEGRQYADALSAAGNRAQMVCFERQIHGFITMGRVIDEARTAVALCAAATREALAGPGA